MQNDKISKLIDKIMPCSSCIYAYKERGSSASDCPKCNYKEDLVDQIKQFARDEWVLSVEKIEKILYELANNQLRGVIKVVDKKGLMNTGWDDIESEGGALDFSIIAEAISFKMRERIG